MMPNVKIEVKRPAPIDGAGGALTGLFNRSQAISEAVNKFWGMGLAAEAELGKVTETATGYDVEIEYS